MYKIWLASWKQVRLGGASISQYDCSNKINSPLFQIVIIYTANKQSKLQKVIYASLLVYEKLGTEKGPMSPTKQ